MTAFLEKGLACVGCCETKQTQILNNNTHKQGIKGLHIVHIIIMSCQNSKDVIKELIKI